MEPYRGRTRRGGVIAFQILPDAIDVEFDSGWVYHFSYTKPGPARVEHMKALARDGRGLSTFISKFVKNRFETRRHKSDLLAQ